MSTLTGTAVCLGRQGWERNEGQWRRGIITKNGRGNAKCSLSLRTSLWVSKAFSAGLTRLQPPWLSYSVTASEEHETHWRRLQPDGYRGQPRMPREDCSKHGQRHSSPSPEEGKTREPPTGSKSDPREPRAGLCHAIWHSQKLSCWRDLWQMWSQWTRTRFFNRMDFCMKHTRDMVFHSVSTLVSKRFLVSAQDTLMSWTTRCSASICYPSPACKRCPWNLNGA